MKIRSTWLGLIVVPAALVLVTAGAANAAPAQSGTPSSAAADERAEANAVAAAQAYIAAHPLAAPNPTNFISNALNEASVLPPNHQGWNGALAVYQPGVSNYSLLSFGQRTDTSAGLSWNTAAGWFVGSGWCTVQFRKDSGSPDIVRQLPDLGPGSHFIGKDTSYFIYPYRSTNPACPSIPATAP